jgi:predicted HAD superfamily Cof-like phosphohydrolase
MYDKSQLHMPAFNLTRSSRNFNIIAGRTINVFNPHQAGFQTGLQCEELSEKIEAVMEGCVTPAVRRELQTLSLLLKDQANKFKAGMHTGDVMRGNRLDMLDADIDLAHVSIAAGYSLAHNFDGACQEVDRANMDKFPGGVVTKDENGKILKPLGWVAPDLSPYIDLRSE